MRPVVVHRVSMSLLRSSVYSWKEMSYFTKHMTPSPHLSARSFLMWKYPGMQMDSSGMWSLRHVSVIVAMSAQFSFSISDNSVVFGTTDLYLFVFMTIGWSHFPHGTCILLLPREVTGGLVNVVRWEVVMTGIFRTSMTAPVGESVECHPCITRSSPGSIVQTGVAAWAYKRCKHSAENMVMRDIYSVLATMVAHERISKSHVTQV